MNSTDICNMALAYIGQGRIASIEEESEEAIQCGIFYDHLRRKLLPGWKYIYAYPAKCLVIRKIYEKESAREIGKEDYFISTVNDSTKVICTDIQNAYASYTADVENGELFTDYFIEALSHSLAANIAVPLSGSPSAANLQYQLMHQALINAKQESAVQNHHETTYPRKYFNMRG